MRDGGLTNVSWGYDLGWLSQNRDLCFVVERLVSLEMCSVALIMPTSNTIYTYYIYSVIPAVYHYQILGYVQLLLDYPTSSSAVLCLLLSGVKELSDGHSWWNLYPCKSVPVPCLELHAASLTRCRPTDQVACIQVGIAAEIFHGSSPFFAGKANERIIQSNN